MAESIHVGIYDVDSRKLIAGPIFLDNLPRQGDILRIDSVYHQVNLIEVDYKAQNEAKTYVTTIGNESEYVKMIHLLAKK